MHNKPILFIDFDGVLCHDLFWRSLPTKHYKHIQTLLFKNDTTLVDEWQIGKHTSEEINKVVSENINISYEEAWDVFVNDCKTMEVPKQVLQDIQLLRNKFITVLLTDNMDCFNRFTRPSLKLDDVFDVVSNSYDEGMRKIDNHGERYSRIINSYNATVKDCIVIDDSIKVRDIFINLGGMAKLVTPEQNILYHLAAIKDAGMNSA